ncbi:MAG: hemolysin III family protein [Rhodothermales bacterium]|nr:hemolysin III family protein [Rhodothermales bacterium]
MPSDPPTTRLTADLTPPLPDVSAEEEWASALTHGAGLVLSLAGVLVLLAVAVARGEVTHVVGSAIFGGTLVFMYTASTLYHSIDAPRLKRVWWMIDHIAIYLLIAGTYTPFVLLYYDGGLAWTVLCLVWGIALAGTVFKLFFTGRFERLSVALYLAMGWLLVPFAGPLLTAAPPGCVLLLAAGGLCYTGGVIFFAWNTLRYNHAIWHLFVLGGSVCHYLALLLYL